MTQTHTLTRDRDEVGRWLSAGLCLVRVCPPSIAEVRRVGPWILATSGERLELPPVGVIADVGALLHGDALSSSTLAATYGGPASTRRPRVMAGDDRLDTAIRRYEDAVLGRLGADPRMVAASDAVAKLPPELRAQGVGILVAGVLAHAGFGGGVAVQPGIVRTKTERSAAATLEQGFAALRDDAHVRALLASAYELLVQGAARARQLIGDAEVFALENLTVLRSLTQRLAIAQVVEVREAIERAFPRRIRSRRASTGAAPTRLEDESAYPVGGFSSMSTSGSLENLVTSELIYMDKPAPNASATKAAVDLFDMRYVEGELLYYTRDEAIFVRQRRVVSFVLLPELVATRVKDPGHKWQRVVMLLGLVVALVQKLTDELGSESLHFRVVLVRESANQPTPLGPERELLELALREWRDKGMADVVESTMEAEQRTLADASRRALVEAVVVGVDEARARAAWTGDVPRHVVVEPHATGLGAFVDFETWTESAVDLVARLL